jgi:hypothetical protein
VVDSTLMEVRWASASEISVGQTGVSRDIVTRGSVSWWTSARFGRVGRAGPEASLGASRARLVTSRAGAVPSSACLCHLAHPANFKFDVPTSVNRFKQINTSAKLKATQTYTNRASSYRPSIIRAKSLRVSRPGRRLNQEESCSKQQQAAPLRDCASVCSLFLLSILHLLPFSAVRFCHSCCLDVRYLLAS